MRIQLREIDDRDVEVLRELNNNPEIAKFVVGNPKIVSYEEQKQWMKQIPNEKNVKRWMIDCNNVPVGTIILSSIDYVNLVGNMNIKILPDSHGKGIGTEALKKACEKAFYEEKLMCLTANILFFNHSSRRLFEKSGFRQDGILRSRIVKNGIRNDLVTYSILKEEWDKEYKDEGNRK